MTYRRIDTNDGRTITNTHHNIEDVNNGVRVSQCCFSETIYTENIKSDVQACFVATLAYRSQADSEEKLNTLRHFSRENLKK